jgi:hypothetical protein
MTRNFLFAILLAPAAAVLPLPAMAQTPQPAGAATLLGQRFQTAPRQGFPDSGHRMARGGKLARLLTPQQLAAFQLQARTQTQGMTPDQRKAWRKDQVRKLTAMSAGDRQQFAAALQARWDALPQRRKDRLQQRIAARGPAPGGQ